MKTTAQKIHDTVQHTNFISGNEMHDAFLELVGDPSPSGSTIVDFGPSHWLAQSALDADVFSMMTN